jgi:sugar O-acyltransferase (sialic acid O-acetyltransferase NeuD family)
MSKEIIIIGAGGHARSITESVIANGYNIKYFVDKNKKEDNLFGYPIKTDLLEKNNTKINILIAITNNYIRENIYNIIKNKYKNARFPSIVDPTAKISNYSKIGKGNMIMARTFIGANSKITDFCIVNNNVSIDHDCILNKFSSLAPAVVIGGNVLMGKKTYIGIGSVIKNNIVIDSDTLIGASSYLNKNTEKSSMYYGVPAKFIRKISIKDKNL